MTSKAHRLLQEVSQELGVRALIVAHESGEALLVAGSETSHTTNLLAALGAAGLSALQEMVTASFADAEKRGGAQMLILEVEQGLIMIYSSPPVLFLAVLPDKTRLGLARLLLRRLTSQCRWESLLPESRPRDFPQLDESGAHQLFADLWKS